MMDTETRLIRETRAAQDLLLGIRSLVGDDEEAVADAVEGETNLFDAIQQAVSAMDECDILLSGIKQKKEELSNRERQTKARADRIIGFIEQALVMMDLKDPLRLPTMTLSLKKVPQSVVISDETKIPSSYWKQKPRPDPVLDTKAILEDLKAKKPIPGAELDNGGISLAIRRK